MPNKKKRNDMSRKAEPPIQPAVYSIRTFCEAHDLSVETYYRLGRAGLGPKVMKVGGRTLISMEAAAAWRREREEAARKQHGERTATATETTA